MPNITTVGMDGLSRGRGRKGGRPKRQRKQTKQLEPLVTIPPYDVAGPSGAFNVCSQSDGSISQSVSIELAAPVMHPVSNGQQNKIQSSPVIQPAGIANVNPFYCKLLAGNIRVCRGCRGSLRTTDGGVPPSTYNLIIARAERCTFRNTSGELITPRRETICHYHCKNRVYTGSRSELCIFFIKHSC